MKINTVTWRKRKLAFWNRMLEDLEIGYLDKDLLPLLLLLNLDSKIYSMSSCSGRITLIEGEFPWSRGDTEILFKKHTLITPDEVLRVYHGKVLRRLWFIVTGPIIHLSTLEPSLGLKILKTARELGYKHSGILHVSKTKGVIIELATGIWVSQLLKTKDEVVVNNEKLILLVEEFNKILMEGKKRLNELYYSLKQVLPIEKDPDIVGSVEALNLMAASKPPLQLFLELSGRR
ncbi:MAG: hypothetical protein QXL34_04615 [Thermosphaera sp.]